MGSLKNLSKKIFFFHILNLWVWCHLQVSISIKIFLNFSKIYSEQVKLKDAFIEKKIFFFWRGHTPKKFCFFNYGKIMINLLEINKKNCTRSSKAIKNKYRLEGRHTPVSCTCINISHEHVGIKRDPNMSWW